MARLKAEVAVAQLNKHGEELCGDCVEVVEGSSTLVVLSDGLGSGVKAHILASMTCKMIATMLRGGLHLDEVVDSLSKTLPVCEVRHLAYSTFSILRIMADGSAYLAEFDNPAVFWGRGDELLSFERESRDYAGKIVKESRFTVQDGDWLVMISDGVLHAGIGGVWNLGWGWDRIGDYLRRVSPWEEDARSLASQLLETTRKLYAGKPGDDATVVVVKIRVPRKLTVLAGPPEKRADDAHVVRLLMESPGKKVVCGGTTSLMVGRELGRRVEVELGSIRDSTPPTGRIEGIDLVTEGILTLTKAADILRDGTPPRHVLRYKTDGPSRLVSLLAEADEISFIVGRAINPAHQSPDLPSELALKSKVVEDLARILRSHGKQVTVATY
ncbi:MAG TPA: SpoIIE family protein phosphatase [Firmicutes bacterium]|nr:SpoIIE family protein phosphatase [Candidatus Fermentithermobacillaceae bacterium]